MSLQPQDFLSLYINHARIRQLAEKIQQLSPGWIHLRGLAGSLPAVLAAAFHRLVGFTQVFILQDETEALYCYTDLKNLLPFQAVLFYPDLTLATSNTTAADEGAACMRYAIWQQLCQLDSGPHLVVTYPEALTPCVIKPQTLRQQMQTFVCGDPIVLAQLTEKLTEWRFELVDVVQQPGQFVVRKGIIDIFSYANQLPYRLTVGEKGELKSIRLFDPANQLSISTVQKVLLWAPTPELDQAEGYGSLLDFLPTRTLVWFKDYEDVLHAMTQKFEQTAHTLQHTRSAEMQQERLSAWQTNIKRFTCIELGSTTYHKPQETITYQATPQPDFKQQFTLLSDTLEENQALGLRNFVLSDSVSQLNRLATLLNQVDVAVSFQGVAMGISQGYVDSYLALACYTDHQLFGRYYRYQSPYLYTKRQAFSLKELNRLHPGDYVVHADYGIARFAGLSKVSLNDKEQEVVRLLYQDNALVYVSLHALHKLSKYAGKEGVVVTMSKLSTTAWEQKKQKVKRQVQDMAKQLIQRYSVRKHTPGFAFSKDTLLQAALESSFIYEDTPDQAAATADVKRDMEAPYPMDRLVCGDVGFGKTEVAIRAAFKAVQDGKQVAVLVPTTILALQHYESFTSRLANFPVQVAYINRFKTQQEVHHIRQRVRQGEVDILIGTHAMLSKGFDFQDLGLLIIDEEQKFGVKAKEHIRYVKVDIDVLSLTATPIPRTLHFSLMGARDLSIIATPPPNRQPIHTSIHLFDKKVIQEAIHHEVQRGGQVFFVHNLVSNILEIASLIQQLVPAYRLGVAHGQMPGHELEKKIHSFVVGDYDILLATNIIESGLDIPNVNTIIINESHLFGLSDLHQMRGRVGRSNKKAFCYLLTGPSASLTGEARRRLSTLEELSELGDGFKVAMRDLDIRGAGNLLGAEQSGFIADVGFETYCNILDEAVQELKENEFKDLFADELASKGQSGRSECTLETDLALSIPTTYVASDTERLQLYMQLDSLLDQAGLEIFQQGLEDRFGPLPSPVLGLMEAVKLRWLAQKLGIQKLKLKAARMQCYLRAFHHSTQVEHLSRILDYVQAHPHHTQLKEAKNALILEVGPIKTIEEAHLFLERILATSPT